jgi:hypothetical protein
LKYTIVLNQAHCKVCGRVLLSLHRHDFRSCACGSFTDGGTEYIRRGGDLEDYTVVLIDGELRFLKDVDEESR